MTLLWISALWVLASAAVAMLPINHQIIPGMGLLLAAPVLIIAIGVHVGWLMAALAIAAFVSMYRNPLRFFWARFKGENPQVPQ